MSRVINPDSSGKYRNQLTKLIVLALTELHHKSQPDEESRDIVAYVILALKDISETIDISVAAWEKRGYWVKADRFRIEWEWAKVYGEKYDLALRSEDWAAIAQLSVQTLVKLKNIKAPARRRGMDPWQGAYSRLMAKG